MERTIPQVLEQDTDLGLASLFRILWTRRWTMLAVFLATVTVVSIAVLRQKPVYESSGTIEIDTPHPLPSLYSQTQTISRDDYVATQASILANDDTASQVGDKLRPLYPAISTGFREHLTVRAVPNTRLIKVSFDAGDPKETADVVNTLFRLYQEQLRQGWSESTQNLSSVLLSQLAESKQKLEKSVADLQDDAQRKHLPLVNEGTASYPDPETQRLESLQTELTRVQAERVEKESAFKEARSGGSAMGDSILSSLRQKESDLQGQLAKLQTTFGPNYPTVLQLQDEIAAVQQQEASEQAQTIQAAGSQYSTIAREEQALSGLADESRKSVDAAAQQRWEYELRERQVDLDKQLYEGLLQQLQQAGLVSQWQGNTARVVDPPKIPKKPISPKPLQDLLLGSVMGCVLSVGVALLDEHLHTAFTTGDSLEGYLGLPLLAALPDLGPAGLQARDGSGRLRLELPLIGENGNASNSSGPRAKQTWFRMDVHRGRSSNNLREALLDLRTSLISALQARDARVLLFTSAVPSEGKTTICSNISIALARLGKRVLLVEGDLRLPSLHLAFGLPNRRGLSAYLRKECDWLDVVRPSGVERLDVIVSGEPSRHPSELLSSERMPALIREAKESYDFVVIDSPTLLKITDGRILATYADAVALVVRSGATPKALVKQAYSNLAAVSEKIVGVILNRWDLSYPRNYYSHYDYDYGETAEEEISRFSA